MPVDKDIVQTPDLVDALVQVTFAIQDVLTRVAARYELSVTQLRLLGILRDRTPPMTEIAQHLRLDRSSVTGLIDRAERRGLVCRRSSPHDARVTVVSVTDKGISLGRKLATSVTEEIDLLAHAISKSDQDCIVRVAGSIYDFQVEMGLAAFAR